MKTDVRRLHIMDKKHAPTQLRILAAVISLITVALGFAMNHHHHGQDGNICMCAMHEGNSHSGHRSQLPCHSQVYIIDNNDTRTTDPDSLDNCNQSSHGHTPGEHCCLSMTYCIHSIQRHLATVALIPLTIGETASSLFRRMPMRAPPAIG